MDELKNIQTKVEDGITWIRYGDDELWTAEAKA